MAETTTIQFYHLLTTPLDVALPKLMEKVLAAGHRAVLHSGDASQLAALSNVLWRQEVALPHGAKADGFAADQPMYLTQQFENPNSADVLVVLDGTEVPTPSYAKLLDVFDGNDTAAVTAARARWKNYKDAGLKLQYIRQQEGGGWKVEAEA